jgi:hypothetical protein
LKPKSDNLFHFTKSLDVLKLIVENGILPRYCQEDVDWFGLDDKYLGYAMSCFCDIPLSRISEHTDFYGSYGIGLSKDWGVQNKLNPVVYTPPGGIVQEVAEFVFSLEFPDESKSLQHELDNEIFRLIMLIKPTVGKMIIAGNILEKEFYQENEWRYVPEPSRIIREDVFEMMKDNANAELEDFKLKFTPKDIKYIFVKNDNDIPTLVDHISEKLGIYPLNDLKILQTRIVSLETLSLDL